jgi:hypothetical protein
MASVMKVIVGSKGSRCHHDEGLLGGSTIGADGPAAGQKLIMVTSSSVLGSVLERMILSGCCTCHGLHP